MEMGLPAERCLCHAIHRGRSNSQEKHCGLEAGYSGAGGRLQWQGDMRQELGAVSITGLTGSSPELPLKELNGNGDCNVSPGNF